MAKSAKRSKLPKRIAGVKIAKNLRRGPLADFVMSPMGQNLVAEVIYHAGASFVTGAEERAAGMGRSARRTGMRAGDVVGSAAHMAAGGASRVAHAMNLGVQAFISGLRDERDDHDDTDRLRDREPLQRTPMSKPSDLRAEDDMSDTSGFGRHH